ncbi:hypothetical protein N7468_008109 [Penicillium chermesinum]|uniref:Uncharacterized protein n=1 Tax=Penicillium chermesinum TaxID=63820 RepID=A0A9W9NP48_9EURO|nr:uncharacterized protein N7468_008109 [Penicillium chermesinum]KAJ5223567.1 hypothetical protein N7468_008109 [Penicillium chermesinum]
MKMENLYQHPGMKVDERYNLWAGKGNERRNVFEDIVAEEHAFQFIGSTNSNLTNARSITAKKYARQCLGNASDTTIQQASRSHGEVSWKEELLPHWQQPKGSQMLDLPLH